MTAVVAIVVHEDGYVGQPAAPATPVAGPSWRNADGTPRKDHCNYCGQETNNLRDVGFGLLICTNCIVSIDKARASGIFDFFELVEFVMLPCARASSGAPVAINICAAPFSAFAQRSEVKPGRKLWWQRDDFWRRGDDLPSLRDRVRGLLKASKP